jgi:hypothetical protein
MPVSRAIDLPARLTFFAARGRCEIRDKLWKLSRNLFRVCWAMRIAMPQLLLSDFAIMAFALDSHQLPVIG